MKNKVSNLTRILFLISSVLLIISLFYPIWRIELDAPQYPEGLMLQIHANKLGGQVEIVNGLNHYIGMQTLHAENFIEFTVLPYIISTFALLFFITAILGRKKLVVISLFAFIAFGIIAMVDFWRWEYNYGHNLDPKAAIVVPGMSYQPPLIGFKQLLNFGAYSIPDIGGWLFILGGVFILIAYLIEIKFFSKLKMKKKLVSLFFVLLFFLSSCNNKLAQPIKLNYDKCNYCEMSISDGRFGAEIITDKGRAYKFDDIKCLFEYIKENNKMVSSWYVNHYLDKNVLIDAEKAFYIKNETLKSPMGGNIAAFKSLNEASIMAEKFNEKVLNWSQIKN